MAPASGDDRSSTPRSIRNQVKQRPQAHNSASRPAKPKKKKASKSSSRDEPEYKLRRLLEEKFEKGKTWYLVDWEDSEDGTSYEPTWEPKSHINAIALAEWEEQNRQAAGSQASITGQSGKRKRQSRQSSAISEDNTSSKRPRLAEAEGAAAVTQPEIPDSYEQNQASSNNISRLQVEIPAPSEGFDRSAYAKAPISSQNSSSSFSQQSSDNTGPFRKGLSISDLIIHDSQDLPGSSTFRPSGITTSTDTSHGTPVNSATNELTQSTQSHNTQPENSLSSRDLHSHEPALHISPQASTGYSPYTSQLRANSNSTFDVSVAKPDSLNLEDQQPILPSVGSGESRVSIPPSPTQTTPSDPHVGSFSNNIKYGSPKSGSASASEFGRFAKPKASAGTRSSSTTPVRQQVLVPASGTATIDFQTGVPEHPANLVRESSSVESECFLTQVPRSIDGASQEPVDDHISQSSVLQNDEGALSVSLSLPLNEIDRQESRSQSQQAISYSSESTWQAAQITSPPAPISTQYFSQGLGGSYLVNTDSIESSPAQSRRGSQQESRGNKRESRNEVSSRVLPSVESAEATPSPVQPRQPSFDSDKKRSASCSQSVSKVAMDSQVGYPGSQPRLSIKEQLAQARHASSLSIAQPLAQQNAASQVQGVSMSDIMVHADSPASNDLSDSEPQETKSQLLPLAQKEYLVPLPMVSWVRDVYKGAIEGYHRKIQEFMRLEQVDERLINEMIGLTTTLKAICSSPELTDPNQAVSSLDSKHQAAYAEDCSTKCMFLRELLSEMQESLLHVAVLAESTEILDIIETICKAYKFEYVRPDRETRAGESNGNMRIVLLSTKTFSNFAPVKKLNCVIVFDGKFGRDQLPSLTGPGAMEALIREHILLVSLKVVNSVEHFELCIPKEVDTLEKCTMLVNCLWQSEAVVGGIDLDISALARDCGAFLVRKGRDPWPIQKMPYIDDIEEYLTPAESQNTAQLQNPLPKRPLTVEESSEAESSKRPRLTPQPESTTETTDITGRDREENAAGVTEDLKEKSKTPIFVQEELDTLREKISNLELQNAEVKGQLDSSNVARDQLERQVEDLEKSVRIIQPKYQEALNERGQAQYDKEKLDKEHQKILKRLEVRNGELARVKEENEILKAERSEDRKTLLSSTVPEAVELTKAREETREAKAAAEKANKKLEIAQKETDYLRENYQQASNRASEAAREIKALKAELETAQQNASSNLVQIHQMHQTSETRELMMRITELEIMLTERTRDLERKTEELRARGNGRRDTRGASAPRSPRISNGTMSPRTVERIVGVSRSRGSSPAASGVGLPPTNESAFRNDAPYPPSSAPRWNHLQ